MPVYPAVGYRFDYKGRSLVISGDTKYQSAEYILEPMKGADVIIWDVMDKGIIGFQSQFLELGTPGSRLAIIMEDILDFHPSVQDTVEVAIKTGAGRMVLTHVVPDLNVFSPGKVQARIMRTITDISAEVANRTSFAEQGTAIRLPANSTDIQISDHGYTPWNPLCSIGSLDVILDLAPIDVW